MPSSFFKCSILLCLIILSNAGNAIERYGYFSKYSLVLINERGQVNLIDLPDTVGLVNSVEVGDTMILFSQREPHTPSSFNNIYSYNISNNKIKYLTQSLGRQKPFSLFENDAAIVSYYPDTVNRITLLSRNIVLGNKHSELPSFSPNGDLLGFTSFGHLQVFSLREQKYLALSSEYQAVEISWINDVEIVLERGSYIQIVNVRKNTSEEVAHGRGTYWQILLHDTTSFLAVKDVYTNYVGSTELILYDLKTNKETVLVRNGSINTNIYLCSDSKLLFSSNVSGKYAIYRYNIASKALEKISKDDMDYIFPFALPK